MKIKFENLISIEEEDHGFIGYASSVERAIDFIIDKNYVYQYTKIYDREAREWKNIQEVLGINEIKCLKEKVHDIEDLNRIFDGYLYFNDKVTVEIY